MYKKILTFVALAAVLLLLQCSDKPTQSEQAKLGESFVLKVGQTVVVQDENLSITFRDVVSDSRCPTNVFCFWSGIAEVQIKLVTRSADTAIVTVAILGGSESNSDSRYAADTLGYHIALLRLDPYPDLSLSARSSRIPEPYQATLKITRSSATPAPVPEVIITDLPPDSIQLDHFRIDSMSIEGDTLSLTVEYGGGCKTHYFFLFMSPATFAESFPVQANLWLRHFDNADSCKCEGKCNNRRQLKLMLTSIAELYHQVYGEVDPIALNISGYTGQQPEEIFRQVYYPEGSQRNRAPQLTSVEPKFVREGDTLRFSIWAVDPDDTTPTLSAVNLPSRASFIDNGGGTGRFLFMPDTGQAGEYQVTFVASDGEFADSDMVSLKVTEARNRAPMLRIFGSRMVVVGGTLVLDVMASDSDGTTPVVTASGLPENAVFTNDTLAYYTFTFTTDSSQVGDHDILFVASDGSLADSEVVTIRVGGTGSLVPTAIGNYWLYEIIDTDSDHGMVAFIDEVRITGSLMDANGHDVWWSLSSPIPPFTTRLMVRHDSVYSESGLEFIRATDEPISYSVTSRSWPGSEPLSGVPRVVSRLDSVMFWTGKFRNCYRYERRACDSSSAGTTCYNETYVIAPGVGIIEIGFEKSTVRPENSYKASVRWHLARYTLEKP
ncbi:MAG: hypothetical protein NT028_08930 [candidate division Zixibacteria bacterium]|nr:hypothetical protein [candidate division Zixibacteria bacterium]